MPKPPTSLPYKKRPVTVEMTMRDYDTVTLRVTSEAGTAEVSVTRAAYNEEAEAVVWHHENPPLYFSLISEARAYLDNGNQGTLEKLERFVFVRWQLHEDGACLPDLADVVDYARRVLLNER